MAKQGIVCPPGTRWESAYCELGKFVTTETQTIIGLAVFVLCILLVADYRLLGKPPNPAFQTRINILRERGFADNYRARLKRWLDVADRWFGQPAAAKSGSWMDRLFGSNPFTVLSYERLLNLVFIYCFVFQLLHPPSDKSEVSVYFLMLILIAVFYSFGLRLRHWINRIKRRWLRSVATATVIGTFFGGAGIFISLPFPLPELYLISVIVAVPVVVSVLIKSFVSLIRWIMSCDERRGLPLLWTTLAFLSITSGAAYLLGSDIISALLLTILIFPLINVPLDWLSLGVTRGLLRCIADGHHGGTSAVKWAVIDLSLAFFFLLAAAASCLLSVLLVTVLTEATGNDLVFGDVSATGEQARRSILEVKADIWLMAGTTLIPTLLHFLIALWACMNVPFMQADANETASQLQVARNNALRRIDEDYNQPVSEVQVDTATRRNAFLYLTLNRLSAMMMFVLWLVAITGICVVLLKLLVYASTNGMRLISGT